MLAERDLARKRRRLYKERLQELQPVSHFLGRSGIKQFQETTHFLANRMALFGNDNNARMITVLGETLTVKSAEMPYVK